jgi:hypothetical protein
LRVRHESVLALLLATLIVFVGVALAASPASSAGETTVHDGAVPPGAAEAHAERP